MVLQCAVVKAMVSTSVGALRPDIAWVRIVDCKPPDKVTGRAGCQLFLHGFAAAIFSFLGFPAKVCYCTLCSGSIGLKERYCAGSTLGKGVTS